MGKTFDDAGLAGGDWIEVIEDPRAIRWPPGHRVRLRDTKRGIRAPDMTNGSAFTWIKVDGPDA